MINISNLKFHYKRGDVVYDNLSLNLYPGRIYGLLGKNGEGKSTLLKLISGMLFPKGGKLTTLGVVATKRQPSFLSQIYYLTEEIYSPPFSIDGYIKFLSPFYPNFSVNNFNSYITEFELDRKQKISSMSLGQKKKFAIAFGLACNTKVLLMDEPTNGLDIPAKSQFRKVISSVATEDRIILISTHQVRDLDNLIDTVLIMDEGKIIVNSSIDTISQRLSFRVIREGHQALYCENNGFYSYGVTANNSGEYSKVDIELLFNGAITNKQSICKILNSNKDE